ncbi:hypothetical protein GGX14DRAFT_677320 [Mycena pura]|uniref:Uncharacterized protein n=1 Tax=Mycena pura TaxID=153505 RepID=A0AAD6Y3V2_9AGAR|nr:hypothetical protein GGX14DRAFT_677320 [Mycena pura]
MHHDFIPPPPPALSPSRVATARRPPASARFLHFLTLPASGYSSCVHWRSFLAHIRTLSATRCTFVKFHRQTAPLISLSAVPLTSGLIFGHHLQLSDTGYVLGLSGPDEHRHGHPGARAAPPLFLYAQQTAAGGAYGFPAQPALPPPCGAYGEYVGREGFVVGLRTHFLTTRSLRRGTARVREGEGGGGSERLPCARERRREEHGDPFDQCARGSFVPGHLDLSLSHGACPPPSAHLA